MKLVVPAWVPFSTINVSPPTNEAMPLAIVFHGLADVPVPVVSLPVVASRVGCVDANATTTEQFPVIALVRKKRRPKVPPQVPLMTAVNPEFGVTVNARVAPLGTDCGVDGLIVPFALADGVTVYRRVKVADAVQFAVMVLVV